MSPFKNLSKNIFRNNILSLINAEDIGAKQQYVLFRIFSFTGSAVALIAFAQLALGTGIGLFHLCILATSVILLVNFYSIDNISQLRRGYFVSVTTAFVLLHIVMYKSGGIRTSGSVYFTIVIVYAFTLLGHKMGRYFTAAAIIHILYTFIISSTTNWTNFDLMGNDIALINRDFLVNFVLIILMIAFVHGYQQSGKNIIIRNITRNRDELQQKNVLLTEYIRTLKTTNQELEKFTNVMSHDLKAPLRAIGSLTDFVEEEVKDKASDDAKGHFAVIKGRISRMENLINGLLNYTKAGRERDRIEIIDTGLLIHEIKSRVSLPFSYEIAMEGIMPVVKSDKVKIEKILTELIHNAIIHNEKTERKVTVSAFEDDRSVSFFVKDNGPGIDPEYFEKIFVIFQTLKTRDQFETCGIGLSIARKIVSDLGGKIKVESSEAGSVFSFSIPKNSDDSIRKLIKETLLQRA